MRYGAVCWLPANTVFPLFPHTIFKMRMMHPPPPARSISKTLMHDLLNKIFYKIRYVICSSRVMLDMNSQNLYLKPFGFVWQTVRMWIPFKFCLPTNSKNDAFVLRQAFMCFCTCIYITWICIECGACGMWARRRCWLVRCPIQIF